MIDPLTTLFATTLTTVTCGGLLLVCCSRDGNAPLLTWAVAMIVAALGFVATAAATSGVGLPESIGVTILIFASALFWTATRLFRGAPAQWTFTMVGPAAWLGTAALHTASPLWTAASCLIGSSYTAASVRELLLMGGDRLPSLLPATVLTLGHATLYLFRALLAVGEAVAPERVVAPAWIGVALLTEAMIHINGSTIVLVALSREQHEQKNSNALRIVAYQDGLTGIANRRRFDERLDELAGNPGRRNTQLGLIMIDLDRFKSINDTVGHGEGDRILRLVAHIIASNVRSDADLAARYGGEEFAVVVASSSLEDLWSTAERIRAAVETAAIPHPGAGGVVTVSLGIGVMDAAELSDRRHEFLARTDHALYRAKQLGRNRVSVTAPFLSESENVIMLRQPVRIAK